MDSLRGEDDVSTYKTIFPRTRSISLNRRLSRLNAQKPTKAITTSNNAMTPEPLIPIGVYHASRSDKIAETTIIRDNHDSANQLPPGLV